MAPANGRNNAYNKAVCNLARLGIDRAVIESALIPEAERIGLTKMEIRATFKSAYEQALEGRELLTHCSPHNKKQKRLTAQERRAQNNR